MKWKDVLATIQEGKQSIPVDKRGLPIIAKDLPLYELLQLLEATTTGYNTQIQEIRKLEQKNELLRKAAATKFGR